MGRASEDSINASLVAAYDAVVALGAGALADDARRMRELFQKRTGAFRPDEPSGHTDFGAFEARSRAFWDDALTTQGFAVLAAEHLDDDARTRAARFRFSRAHRGLFRACDVDDRGARLVDVWSGAELVVGHLDEAQAVALEHAEGLMDARVVATSPDSDTHAFSLFVLPGAFHHAADASDAAMGVVAAARERKVATGDLFDALMRMDLVFKASSRVKAAFAYRVDSLPRSAV
jgi:hypothetical protein